MNVFRIVLQSIAEPAAGGIIWLLGAAVGGLFGAFVGLVYFILKRYEKLLDAATGELKRLVETIAQTVLSIDQGIKASAQVTREQQITIGQAAGKLQEQANAQGASIEAVKETLRRVEQAVTNRPAGGD